MGTSHESGSGSSSSGKPFQPAPGRDFPVDPAAAEEARTKGFLARWVVVAVCVSVAVTGIYGLFVHNFLPLQSVWNVAGFFAGAVINHYFGGGYRKDSG